MVKKRITVTYSMVLASVVLTLCAPIFIRESAGKRKFSDNHKNKIIKENPDYVFVGNSMVQTRINAELYSKISGSSAILLAHGGLGAAGWYLMLKNQLFSTNVRPKIIFVFFRDTELTEPMFRTQGKYKDILESYSLPEEPVFNEVLKKTISWKDKVDDLLLTLYPIQSFQNRFINWLTSITFKPVKLMGPSDTPFNYSRFSKHLNSIFSFNNTRPLIANDMAEFERGNFDFDSALKGSFLVHIVDLLRDNKQKAFFIRVQRRPPAAGKITDKPELTSYLASLRAYLTSAGHLYHDFTGDPKETLEIYGDGDHISPQMKDSYTQHFYETVKHEVK